MVALTLASSSVYRRQLLSRLGLDFDCCSPNIDETPLPDEAPAALVARLARQKAEAVARRRGGLIIASDQVATLDQRLLTKPGKFAPACEQLRACSGRRVMFYTSLALLNTDSGRCQLAVETTEVGFRPLSAEQIERYVEREQPYDCAGSFKVEGLGISLFTHIRGDDPNALIGLPTIELVSFLAAEGITLP